MHQRQGEFGDLRLQGGHLLLQQAQLEAHLSLVLVRTGWRSILLGGRSANGHGNGLGSRAGQGRGQVATMQLGNLLELWKRQTFETSIGRMRTPAELGSFEPEPQGFGIHP